MDYPINSLPLKDLLKCIVREDATAQYLLDHYPTLQDLAQASPEELTVIPGIGPTKAKQIAASIELARRFNSPLPERPQIKSPQDVFNLLSDLRFQDREHFKAIHLNTKHFVLSVETISVGTLNSSLVHPREIFKNAVKRNTAALIIAHNHPSAVTTPSAEDREITKNLVEAGKLMGIEILDHVIIGYNGFTSFKEKGLL